jgi:phosphoribosylformylglycinamidine synthase subunit PurS
MPQYTVFVNILPKDEILDPQGKAVLQGLHHLDASAYAALHDVRVGKQVRLKLEAPSPKAAQQLGEHAAQQLLANAITEQFVVEVQS